MNNVIMNPDIGCFAPILENVRCTCSGNLRLLKWIGKGHGNLAWYEKCGCLSKINSDNNKQLRIYEYEYSVIVGEFMQNEKVDIFEEVGK